MASLRLVSPAGRASAFCVVLQADDGTDAVERALEIASAWTDGVVAVVNGTGRDLAAYAQRHRIEVLEDADGRPSRSLTEITEALEEGLPPEVGAFVVLDTNTVYRATRCAVRAADDIRTLSPGHWDDTNEALGAFREKVTRAGLPSVFFAPSTDVYGVSEDGERTIVGSKPQGWKDLPRGAHACIHLRRSGAVVDAVVMGDDRRCIGDPGESVRPSLLAGALRSAGRSSAPSVGTTTLRESTRAELDARRRRVERARVRSSEMRARFENGEALLRAHHGRDAWSDLVGELEAARLDLTEEDAEAIDQALAKLSVPLDYSLRVEVESDRTAGPVHDTIGLPGPSVLCAEPLPADDTPPVDWLLDVEAPNQAIADIESDELQAWCHATAERAGVWTEHGMAAAAVAISLPCAGPDWGEYADDQLRILLHWLVGLAKIYRRIGPIRDEGSPPDVDVPDFDDEHVAQRDASVDRKAVALADARLQESAKLGEGLRPMAPPSLEGLPRGLAASWVDVVLHAGGWRERMDELFHSAGVRPRSVQPIKWSEEERAAVYQVATRTQEQREVGRCAS